MKPLRRISVATTREAEDAVAELLGTVFHRSASSYFDIETQTCVVSVYFSETGFLSREIRVEILSGLKRIKNCGLTIGSGKIKTAKVRREDWAESWKRHFKPIEIGNSLLVRPSWSKRKPRKNQAVVILDPGLSFGTGQHPTTSFCLGEIVRCHKIGICRSFLDIGTGSGILAIAAAKLGYEPVRAIDFDPEAMRVARANIRLNGAGQKKTLARGDVTKLPIRPEQKHDLICANLISSLLIAERGKIAAQLSPGGFLVLAGILKPEFPEVQKEFESLGLKLISSRSEKEWRSGTFAFRA
ncbi:MAG TPA: 50S ribosomal protein L11 methyltransferase [Candidatus Paceibacterota bacterium]|nr:50S ribosomal protein L11 methyltransferase [Candidatus Paceibacterota bacterium]